MTREEAWELLTEFNQDEFHLQHGQTVEKTMMYFAEKLGHLSMFFSAKWQNFCMEKTLMPMQV